MLATSIYPLLGLIFILTLASGTTVKI